MSTSIFPAKTRSHTTTRNTTNKRENLPVECFLSLLYRRHRFIYSKNRPHNTHNTGQMCFTTQRQQTRSLLRTLLVKPLHTQAKLWSKSTCHVLRHFSSFYNPNDHRYKSSTLQKLLKFIKSTKSKSRLGEAIEK